MNRAPNVLCDRIIEVTAVMNKFQGTKAKLNLYPEDLHYLKDTAPKIESVADIPRRDGALPSGTYFRTMPGILGLLHRVHASVQSLVP